MLTSTPAQMEAAGALASEFPDLHIQTHLSENRAEIEFTQQLRRFTDTPVIESGAATLRAGLEAASAAVAALGRRKVVIAHGAGNPLVEVWGGRK